MQASLDMTKKETKIARNESKRLYYRNAIERMLHVGQLVLMYLPVNGKPLATKLHGPYKILEHIRTLLINLLKPQIEDVNQHDVM